MKQEKSQCRSKPNRALWLTLAFAMVGCGFLIFTSPLTVSGETWTSLDTGKWIAESLKQGRGISLSEKTFFGAGLKALTPVHWLGDLTYYRAWARFGVAGVAAITILFAAFLFFILGSQFREARAGTILTAISLGLGIALYQATSESGAFFLGMTLFATFVILLGNPFRPLSTKRILALCAVAIVWANLDPSAALAPLIALIFFCCLGKAGAGWRFGFPLLVAASVCLTPQGVYLFGHFFELLSTPWKVTAPPRWAFTPIYGNLYRAVEVRWSVDAISLFLLSFLWLIGIAEVRKQGLGSSTGYRWLVGLLILALSYLALPFRILLVVPMMWVFLWWDSRLSASSLKLVAHPLTNWVAAPVAMLGIAALLCVGQSPAVMPMPTEALKFIREAGLQGKLYNHIPWGGYLAFHGPNNIELAWDSQYVVHADRLRAIETDSRLGRKMMVAATLDYFSGAEMMILDSAVRLPRKFRDEWVAVFDNNVSLVAVRRSSSDNLARAASYYATQQIPFDRVKGYSARIADEKDKAWTDRVTQWHQPTLWTSDWDRANEVLRVGSFFSTRKLNYRAIQTLESNLLLAREVPLLAKKYSEYVLREGKMDLVERAVKLVESLPLEKKSGAPMRAYLRANGRHSTVGMAE